jgi:hypothetical protein
MISITYDETCDMAYFNFDDDEVAKLQAIQEEQNAQWQQYVARINQCTCTLP